MQLFDFIGKTFNLLVYQDHQLLTDLVIASRISDNKHILIKLTTCLNENFYFPFNRKNKSNFLDILDVNNHFRSPPVVAVEILVFVKLTASR